MKDLLGKVKRIYAAGDFNPFKAMEHVYENCLSKGDGHVVLVAGYTQRFVEDTIKAYHHVLISRGISDLPVVSEKEMVTHTGTRLRFVKFDDHTDAQLNFERHCKECSIVVLCNPYRSVEMINIIRETNRTTQMYDYSKNNEKVVDKG